MRPGTPGHSSGVTRVGAQVRLGSMRAADIGIAGKKSRYLKAMSTPARTPRTGRDVIALMREATVPE